MSKPYQNCEPHYEGKVWDNSGNVIRDQQKRPFLGHSYFTAGLKSNFRLLLNLKSMSFRTVFVWEHGQARQQLLETLTFKAWTMPSARDTETTWRVSLSGAIIHMGLLMESSVIRVIELWKNTGKNFSNKENCSFN